MSAVFSSPLSYSLNSPDPPQSQPPTHIRPIVYRVHRSGAQTRYNFSAGFSSKNQTTVVTSTSSLFRFGLAHLNQQTNISSPFISVYDSHSHADKVAKHFATTYEEDTFIVSIDTRHLARGPIFRAADLLKDEKVDDDKRWLHHGEYLVTYRIPAQAIRDQTPIAKVNGKKWRAPGAI